MNEIQQLETWQAWDEINLSTPELRQQHLEILLCQRLKNGEDISQCLQALEHLRNQEVEQKLSQGQQTVTEEQQREIEKTAAILYQIKERPTMLFATPEDKMLGLTQLVVDNHKVETVTKWLTDKNIAIAQVPPEEVPLETKKGLAVFTLANSSIPEPVFEAMTKKFGEVIESSEQYQQKVRSLPDRPKHLKPLQSRHSVTLSQTPPQQQNFAPPSQESQTVTIDHLRSWYIAANNLGKPEEYKQRIVEIANEFKATNQLSAKALAAMEQDTLSRVAQISQKIASNLGQRGEDGTTRVAGKIYDLSLNSERQDLVIAHKNGDVILRVQAGQVQINKVTPQVLQDFESANTKLDEALESKKQTAGIQR
ncbi:hypothetical protein [Nostoc sp. FACHB-145]|uniref:hypothetical protein n=1 Tax=Nostoc sp. FACHB-145 TaxID=2692836 RepID=UPI001688F2DB|nr:hypothetical protein [Nostoc sp. FACHB-145]MBD2473196.1 hypothetical protein [Nostoc sp. FACHB-145]